MTFDIAVGKLHGMISFDRSCVLSQYWILVLIMSVNIVFIFGGGGHVEEGCTAVV